MPALFVLLRCWFLLRCFGYEEFDNGYVKMNIHKGWKFVARPQADTIHYTFGSTPVGGDIVRGS